jgi:hypothetical protein
MVYGRHGQSAALQTFFSALELKIFDSPVPTHNYLRKFDFLKPKYDIFEEHFRNLLRFSQICRQIFKIVLNPSTPLFICLMFVMNLRP